MVIATFMEWGQKLIVIYSVNTKLGYSTNISTLCSFSIAS